MSDEVFPLLVILGFGGIALYLLTRPEPLALAPPVVASPVQQCGAGYNGASVSVPCALIGEGIKEIYNKAAAVLQKSGITPVVETGTKGFGAVDVVLAPVAINHALYNYGVAGYHKLTSWL